MELIKETKKYKFYREEVTYKDNIEYYLFVETLPNCFGYPNFIIFHSLINYTQLHRIETQTTIKEIKSIIMMNNQLLELVLHPIIKPEIEEQYLRGTIEYV